MDQVVAVIGGVLVLVFYIKSPLKLAERIMAFVEKFGSSSAPVRDATRKARKCYVNSHR